VKINIIRSTANYHLVCHFASENMEQKMIAHLAINRHRTNAVWLVLALCLFIGGGIGEIGRVVSTSSV